MVSIQKVMESMTSVHAAGLRKVVQKTVPYAVISGRPLLLGASGGPDWQFSGVPPIGVDIKDYHDSVDNNVFEILGGTLDRTANTINLPEGVATVKETLADRIDSIKAGLGEWGDSVIEVLSEML